ncbi:transposase [Xenorhabdus sp. TS4]|nr:transposase [Xenorhabdus sp. TS4]
MMMRRLAKVVVDVQPKSIWPSIVTACLFILNCPVVLDRYTRAVDLDGNTIDFLLTVCRDKKAALRFFKKAIGQHGQPAVVTMDKSGANKAAVDELNPEKPKEEIIVIRQNKPLNNLIEQDHRNIKRRISSMLGFNNFRRAQTLLAGIEWVSMLRKGQYLQKPECPMSPAAFFYQLIV